MGPDDTDTSESTGRSSWLGSDCPMVTRFQRSCDRKFGWFCHDMESKQWKSNFGTSNRTQASRVFNSVGTLSYRKPEKARVASASLDGSIRVWIVGQKGVSFTMATHTKGVTCLRWMSDGNILSASRDCTIRVWNSERGALVRTLKGHGHWVNTMALNTDYALRTGPFDHSGQLLATPEALKL